MEMNCEAFIHVWICELEVGISLGESLLPSHTQKGTFFKVLPREFP